MSNILPPSSKEEKALTNKEKHLSPKDDVILKVRWSLQDEIAKIFNPSIKDAFRRLPVSCTCSISTCPTEDGDYLCTNVVEAWPELRKTRRFLGPTEAGLTLRRNVMLMNTRSGMIERCVVCGPGFLTFKLSMKWITKSIHKMVRNGMGICAPKLSVERAILYFLSGNVAEKMHIGHLRSGVIGETLARILEYSRVEVIRKFHEEDVLELKMMMEFLIEMFPNGIVNDPSPRELEVWYMELKKRFDEDAEFRDRAQKLQSQVLEISKRREQNQEVYVRLAVHVKEEVFNSNITETLDLPREIAAFWHALNRADWILHVTDVGQRDHCEICTSAAKRTGCIVNDGGAYPLRHVGFGPVQADDYLVNLLGEAKIRCKAVLLGQGKADEWTAEELDDTAEALGYDAVKYAVLKKNRLTKCTINFDEILNEKGNTVVYLHYTHAQVCSIITEYTEDIKRLKKLKGKKVEKLTLKNNEERKLGLHLLRFTEVLGEVCTLLMPHILCEYLYDLCKKFDSFYSCVSQVVGYGAQKTKLLLCEATAMVMRKCFHLLGITFDSRRLLRLSRLGSKLSKRCYFSDLTEQQLMELFCKGPSFRFDLCKVFLRHIIDVGIANRSIYDKLFLCGVIQAETHISDGSLNILHRNFDNPLVITKPSFLSPHDICYSSLSVSTFVKITAKLYGTTYKGDGMESISEYRKYYPTLKCDSVKHRDYLKMFLETGTIFLTREKKKKKKKKEKVYIDDDVFHICDDNVIINFSEYFADRPNGGSGYSKLKGKDGYLDLYYVALKYAVEAALEVEFVATSKKTKVFGRVMAYYGNNFSYDCCASKRYFYNVILSETKQPSHIEPGKLNLMRSALGVPAQYSLIIDAKLHDFTSGDMILSGVCEFFVPVDGSSSVGFINGSDCSLKLKVDWKLPF